ncbi:Uncharacterised protein [Mycobacteroides abscessus subsp. abscessus]|nr:Uncharacterised protein [Mycobacteroides abscessus subsp. abscessus]
MRVIASSSWVCGSKKRVTSSVLSTKAKIRTRENCSRSALTSSRVKLLNPATEPETSHSSTSSGRPGRGLRFTRSIGTPPVDMDLRNVFRRSISPRRCFLRRAANREASTRARRWVPRRSSASSRSEARRKSTSSACLATP